MTKPVSDYLSEHNAPDEQRWNAVALCRGMYSGTRSLVERIARYHDLLELELGENTAGRMYLGESRAAVNKLLELVQGFHSVTQAKQAAFESLDLRVLLDAVANRQNKTGELSITVDFSRVERKDTFILGHLFLLQQLFLDFPHLMIPAQTATRPLPIHVRGDMVSVDVESVSRGRSPVPAGDYVKVTFTLSGHDAPPPTEVEKLVSFERTLLRSAPDTQARLLYVCGVVREHGGDLFFVDADTATQSCVLYFPALKNRISMYPDTSVHESGCRGTETILLVDDEDIIWDVVTDMLQNMGYTVILAADGNDCVEIYRENPGEIDLVLLDMVMPGMDGHEAFFKLKEIDPNVKVLLSSGYVKEEDARDVLNAGAAGFLQKPYRMLDLAKKIKQIVSA